ncbi:putative minus-end-directed kinesin ATPase [Dioscorea sansibarensis]
MESGGVLSMMTVVEDVLKQQGKRLNDVDLASRKAEEAAARRNEAAGWLRKTVGVVAAKDLPEEPSEEEFRLGLRSGMILCNVLNKVVPGAVPKVVETPGDSVIVPDGAALSAYQYFENVRNFLVALQDMGLPTFEASDLEQGGKSSRVVNCVLAIKSYSERKQMGGNGSWKYGGNLKPVSSGKYFVRKNSEPFMTSFSRTNSMNDKYHEQNINGDSATEASEMLVETMLSKVMEEFEHRIGGQNELVKTTSNDIDDGGRFISKPKVDIQEKHCPTSEAKDIGMNLIDEGAPKNDILLKQNTILAQQERDIQDLKQILSTTKAGMQYMKTQYSEEFNNLGKHLQYLSHAASGYHKVLEENRKLYNQVQDLKGNIRVYCRVRPFLPAQSSIMSTVGRVEDGNITIITPLKYGKEGRKSFSFNKVFGPSASQEEVFADTQPLIRSVLDGYNVCMFAYGQTGSGKTYTMSGPKVLNEQSHGVNYRALSDLFYLSEQRKDTFHYDIAVQMIEIYNEQVRDLLATDEIRNSSQKGLNVPDASLIPVTSTSEVIELMNIGQKNRAVGSTALNDRSSRSHSCLTIHVQGRDITSGSILRGCMHLVDLAGSERVDKSEVKGERLKEAQHINKSLSALGDVIAALAQKNAHVPYRNSKLTQLLQDSLGGQAKTLMFVHISPEADAIGETLSTLKFAERVATVELGAARLNKESGEIKELKEQIASLKAALARKDGEFENLQSTMSSPDLFARKAGGALPLSSNRQHDEEDCLINHRQPMEEVGNIEVRGNSGLKQKSTGFDLQQLLLATGSHPWPDSDPSLNFHKHGAAGTDDDSPRDWEGDNGNTPDFFYKRYQPDTRDHLEQQYNRNIGGRNENHEYEVQRSRFDNVATDDSDDLDVATSDSSEADMLWQFNLPKVTSTPNGVGTRIKKPLVKLMNSPDIRTPNRSHIPSPSPSRKLQSSAQSLSRNSRLPSFDANRNSRLPIGRTGNGK